VLLTDIISKRTKKALKQKASGLIIIARIFFFHPDCTVGPGIKPGLPIKGSRAFSLLLITAGKELHLSLKKQPYSIENTRE